MIMSTSPEFMALCQSQIELLTQGLGAALGVVYLTEELVDGVPTKLRPITAYPENAIVWDSSDRQETNAWGVSRLLGAAKEESPSPLNSAFLPSQNSQNQQKLLRQRKIVRPLIYEETVLGFLVTGREDRKWTAQEYKTIEQVAQTLAIACVMEQRQGWLGDQLAQQQMQLQLRQNQQHDVLDNLLHQFRNPLTALRTFGKLLVKRLRPGDANYDVANSIVRESDRLQDLLQQFKQVMDWQEAEILPLTLPSSAVKMPENAGSLPSANQLLPQQRLNIKPCWLVEVLWPLLETYTTIAQDRNLTLTSQLNEELPPVQADAIALREVFTNLLENALKYTPSGGQVRLELTEHDGDEVILISDTGPGIPPQDLPHIFQRHYRGIQGEGEIPGTGLGLAIAKELVEQMGGKIAVKSPAVIDWADANLSNVVGATVIGTTFKVSLPIPASQPMETSD